MVNYLKVKVGRITLETVNIITYKENVHTITHNHVKKVGVKVSVCMGVHVCEDVCGTVCFVYYVCVLSHVHKIQYE